jgi:hypothetical protein
MERQLQTGEQGSREWQAFKTLERDRVSMFGTPQKPEQELGHRMRPSLLELIRLEPRRQS